DVGMRMLDRDVLDCILKPGLYRRFRGCESRTGLSQCEQRLVSFIYFYPFRILGILPVYGFVPRATIVVDRIWITKFAKLPDHFRTRNGEEKCTCEFEPIQSSRIVLYLVIPGTIAIFQHFVHKPFFIVAFHI